jgi:hypothetical protein
MVAIRPVWPLGALGDHHVASGLERPPGVVHLSAHVDDQDVVLVAEVDHLGRNAESGDEDRGTSLDDLLDLPDQVSGHGGEQVDTEGLVRGLTDAGDLGHHLLVGHRRGAEAAEPSDTAVTRGA